MFKQLVDTIRKAGGTPYLVGGAVLDRIAGREPKDLDLEVFGLSLDALEAVLTESGFTPKAVGKAFGILSVTSGDGLTVDVSVPRRENRVGRGHRDFRVEFDPNMTLAEAGRRRDLTVNAMSMNPTTFEIFDPFGGLKDLEDGVMRATDPVTFVEDPLRVLRVAQLLARKGKTVDPDTERLCAEMVARGDLDHLPRERVGEEFHKLLMKAPKPSVGFRFLERVGYLARHMPELAVLRSTPQNPEYHPEGDVFEHTMMVLDNAAALRNF